MTAFQDLNSFTLPHRPVLRGLFFWNSSDSEKARDQPCD